MRIAILTWESLHSIAVGGVAPHVTELTATLAKKGHQVHVFTRRAHGQLAHDCIDGVHYHRCSYTPHHDFVDDINNMCRSFVDRVFEVEDFIGHFDVVHAHDWLAANAMIWIKQGREHGTVLTIHSTEYARCGNALTNGRSVRVRDQERAGTYWADHLIAVSQATKDELKWLYDVPDWKTSVIHNGVRPKRFDVTTDPGEDKRRYQIAPLDPTVLFCGRLAWQKGPDLLVEAIPGILQTQPGAKFIFAGDGDMRGGLEARVRQLGVAHAVRFLGHQNGDDLIHLFKLADVICVPSRNEPFGIVVLEAWSADKPVVVTQTGGPNEYVWHEVNGLRIYPEPGSVAWGVNTMFSDFERARRMGHNGRVAVMERFRWETIADQTLDVYRQVCPATVEVGDQMQSRKAETAASLHHQRPHVRTQRIKQYSSVGREIADSVPVRLGARLSFHIPHPGNGDSARLAVFKETLERQGLAPQEKNANLRIDGDWETVLAALLQCDRCAYRPANDDLASLPVRRLPEQSDPPAQR
jgi:glycosyltransferase involved in cell wall biosynthesis